MVTMKEFVTEHWRMLVTIIIIGLLLYFFVFKESPMMEQVRVHEDKWKAQNIKNYRIRVQTLYPAALDIYEVVVRDEKVTERTCIQLCMVDKDGYTVPELFQTARDTISNPSFCAKNDLDNCLKFKYDDTYGYPTLISRQPQHVTDVFFVLTVLSFEVLK